MNRFEHCWQQVLQRWIAVQPLLSIRELKVWLGSNQPWTWPAPIRFLQDILFDHFLLCPSSIAFWVRRLWVAWRACGCSFHCSKRWCWTRSSCFCTSARRKFGSEVCRSSSDWVDWLACGSIGRLCRILTLFTEWSCLILTAAWVVWSCSKPKITGWLCHGLWI